MINLPPTFPTYPKNGHVIQRIQEEKKGDLFNSRKHFKRIL